jgi:shikimate kinase
MNRVIFLVGYRGSGKTTVGGVLARRLGWDFFDADTVLEAQHGKTIKDIFAAEGEPGFRDKESAILADLCRRSDAVIATGGGVVLREANRDLLRRSGFVAWLSADARALWARIQDDPATAARRPALAGGGLAEVEQLLAARERLYRASADVEVPVAGLSPEQAADAILAAWTSHSLKSSG